MLTDFIKTLIVKYALDRGVWVGISLGLSHLISRKLGMDISASMITDLIVSFVTWAATHWLHVTVVENKMAAQAEVKPEVETKIDSDFKK